MPPDRLPPGPANWRRALLCLLLLGLLLHGQAGVLRHLLGAAHRHAPAAAAPAAAAPWAAWLARAQAWRQQWLAHSPLLLAHGAGRSGGHVAGHVGGHVDGQVGGHVGGHVGHAGHGHHHDGSARHHHASHDASVVLLEPGGHSADPLADAPAGSLLQPLALALADRLHWPGTVATPAPWPQVAAAAWRDAASRQPERPPRG
jgi:hypothetical protein